MPTPRAADDGQTPVHERFCDFCGETGHGVFNCPERDEFHRDRQISEAARRLDPVCRDPE